MRNYVQALLKWTGKGGRWPRHACNSVAILSASFVLLAGSADQIWASCPDEQETRQITKNFALCAQLDPVVRKPSDLPLNKYEQKLEHYLKEFCYRNLSKGWKVDKYVRDTGPYIASYQKGQWSADSYGTHAPVLVWYSPEMYQWLKANRAGGPHPTEEAPVPDGAIIVKEMYPAPASTCKDVGWEKLRPTSEGAVVMIRDSKASHDGWFWGWFGWAGWSLDWGERADGRAYPFMGFGLYCTNCHASAKGNQTFSALRNIQGERGQPVVFLTQNSFHTPPLPNFNMRVVQSNMPVLTLPSHSPYVREFLSRFQMPGGPPRLNEIAVMPSESYDHLWARAGKRSPNNQFLTSDQCLGCHSADGTGLQYDMTEPGSDDKLINISPYGTWRGSPMALSGRDPIFFAQLESETRAFHPQSAAMIEDVCAGCHGVMGQRQFAIDRQAVTGVCEPFTRSMFDGVPYPHDRANGRQPIYGALSRDGVSCESCHQMTLGAIDAKEIWKRPENKCALQRQQLLNPGLTGFAKTFTGAFGVASAGSVYGPFANPKQKPMQAAIGTDPVYKESIRSSELCGSCHTVHVPVLVDNQTVGHTYEQTTYAEWAFSDYRTGVTPKKSLPFGPGAEPRSCQSCHMPNKDAHGNVYRSKIAAIQEYVTFPQAEHTLPPPEIDLAERSGFAKHTLVGLNFILLEMAQQFADILGLRRAHSMLGDKGVEALVAAKQSIIEQAATATATITVSDVRVVDWDLIAKVTLVNRTGHKFPSGVAFRRAFIEFNVLDANGAVLWGSGRTNSSGIIVDQNGKPIAGELWWKGDCSARIEPAARLHQPHYEVISRQDQAQIYEELVSTPALVDVGQCGSHAEPQGELTTSFLSICSRVKDNRLLPKGFLSLDKRTQIALDLGAGTSLAEEVGAVAVGEDPDYREGGADTIIYRVPLTDLRSPFRFISATLYYEATPPYYLQDRFCTANGDDTKRLYYVAGKLRLEGTASQNWKLKIVSSGSIPVP